MKQKKIYETPGVEIMPLGMESIICTSGDIDPTTLEAIGLNQGFFDDFSSDITITVL